MKNKFYSVELDKSKELLRYDKRAERQLESVEFLKIEKWGSDSMPLFLRSPYLFYEKHIRETVRPEHKILELGSGSGLHTHTLLQTGAEVTATDISPNSLTLLQQNLKDFGDRLSTQIADMECLPFPDSSFDVIACAGSLSYGDPSKVDAEIQRLLKPNGFFICVDSLHHNPIYKINRWIHYLRGQRTRSTLERMPTLERIKSISSSFEKSECYFFGSLTWLSPFLSKLIGEFQVARFSDKFDRKMKIKRSAFKFVLILQNPLVS